MYIIEVTKTLSIVIKDNEELYLVASLDLFWYYDTQLHCYNIRLQRKTKMIVEVLKWFMFSKYLMSNNVAWTKKKVFFWNPITTSVLKLLSMTEIMHTKFSIFRITSWLHRSWSFTIMANTQPAWFTQCEVFETSCPVTSR